MSGWVIGSPSIIVEGLMPKALENKLKSEARKKGFTGKRANAYVYGTMRKTGWVPKKDKNFFGHMKVQTLF
jgi:hypothetical protein